MLVLTMSKELKERNIEIYNDWKSGMKYLELVLKYRISSSVITRIVERYKTNEK